MAAGKNLWVKLRYRIQPSPASSIVTGPSLDPSKSDATAIRTSLGSPLFENSLDFDFDPSYTMAMPLDTSLISHTPEHSSQIGLPTPPMNPLTTAEILSQRKNRSKAARTKQRSLSTSHINTSQDDDSGLTLAEKRRNKLGYHRTSIACSHCRRRKIRCLAAPDDPHNRCANCIRLKKECNFFPVDQQPPIERRNRTGQLKSEKRTNSDASRYGPNLLDAHDHPNPFHGVPFGTQGYAPSTAAWSSSGVVSPTTRVSIDHGAQPFDFNQQPQPHRQWPSPFPDPGPMSAGHSSPGDVASSYWGRHTDSPLTPAYSPHMSAPTTAMNNMDARNSIVYMPTSRNDSTWSAPARSASMGVVDELNIPGFLNPKHHSFPQASIEYRRRPSEMHPPPPLLTSTNSAHGSMSDACMTPMSAPVSSPPDTWGIGPGWGALPGSAVTKPTDFGTWYSEPTLAKVQEEEIPPPYGVQPAIV